MSFDKTVCAIDFETSGRQSHFACAVGLARVEKGLIKDFFYSLIRPPSSYVMFSDCHGLYWGDLKCAPTFSDVFWQIQEFIEGSDYLVAHNARFDRRVLQGCCDFFDEVYPDLEFLDTLKGARSCLALPSHSLDKLCEHFNIPLEHHKASSDAAGCAEIYIRLLEMGCPIEDMLI